MITDFAAWVGACVSSILAVVKIWEMWRERFRVEISRTFTTLPEIGNTITVRNLCGRPIIIKYWELLWLKGHWPFRQKIEAIYPEELDCDFDIRVEPHDSCILEFRNQHHFEWGRRMKEGTKIYLRLYIAGKKLTVLRKVHE